MARITVEDCLDNVPNRFSLVLLTAERTKQLMKGAQRLISDERDNKEIVTALREIAAGSIAADTSAFDENEQVEKEARAAEGLPPSVEDILGVSTDSVPENA
ncbi:MAG: DNA-directed RNA polymerase subunit omega [Myxococcales bacterium]|nr:DNA-directed RNA polymerase subunit omega [Myxococcales bacterium]